jgi:limonene-1,2-epoxide hydrolase
MTDATSELQAGRPTNGGSDWTPTLLVERFLDLLCSKDIEGAADLLAVDVEYVNVGLPTVRGREHVQRLLRATLGLAGAGFEV